MTPKQAREWAQRSGDPCPHCGGRIVVEVDTGPDGERALRMLAAAGYTRRFVPIEEAEEQLRTNDWEQVEASPIAGGRKIEG